MKKGFTLIELLAVIIILAIIALIATPIILNVIEDARKSAGLSESEMIMSGINNYCATSKINAQLNSDYIDICSDSDEVTIEDVSNMVQLGNAKVLDIVYKNDKLLWLQVESNGNIYSLENNKMVIGEGNKEDIDLSGANAPKLYNNMIPIKYDGTNWVYANESESWYNYDKQEWANAVVLNGGVSKKVGDMISEDEIALWYVWIPRYTYTIFNGNNESVEEQVIDVKFENGTNSTGTVKCVDAINQTDSEGNQISEICTDSTNGSIINGTSTYTHPAFTFGSEELTGFWVGKFEISTIDDACNSSPSSANCNKVLPITIKPGVSSFRNTTIPNFFSSIKNIESQYNLNGDSHMIKNMEWGAVAYLKQSKYGLGLTDIAINNNGTTYYTGGGASNAYKDNVAQSTTGNIYGVYDMSGNALERVMGNMVNSDGEFYNSDSGFTSAPEEKYYDKYTYGTSAATHSRCKLGDATKETLTTFGSAGGGWYSDDASFVVSTYPWVFRGNYYSTGSNAGVFYFSNSTGHISSTVSSRAILS